MSSSDLGARRIPIATALDTATVVVFVAIGRRNHDEDPGIGGVFVTAAPFLLALALGWLVTRAWQRPTDVLTGVALWAITLVGGMLFRRVLFDDGTALAFVIVAAVFLGSLLVGWRAVAALTTRR